MIVMDSNVGSSNCATELTLGIFLLLDNIDDALHLARSSRQLNTIFERYKYDIAWNIVVRVISRDYVSLELPFN
jgi:hypothetical protein